MNKNNKNATYKFWCLRRKSKISKKVMVKDMKRIFDSCKVSCLIIFIIFFISFPALADTVDIYCPKCHKFLWILNYKLPLTLNDLNDNNLIEVDDIYNVWKKPSNPIKFICPIDGAPLNGWEYWAYERGMHPPVMVYPALTVMTLNEQGDFVWFPDDVVVSDN